VPPVGQTQRIPEPELRRLNMVAGMLSDALLGAISPNFRMVAINLAVEPWPVRIVLERDDPEDREEIEDVEREFDRLISAIRNPGFVVDVVIDDQTFATPQYPWIAVFRRREAIKA
jgi:hypothetical protein